MRFRTTNQHTKYWENRKIDWNQQYLSTWNHPHRHYILRILSTFNWISLMEIGVGAGANLMAIIQYMRGKQMQLGGVDISKDAIEAAQKNFQGGVFRVCSGEDLMMSDKSVDVALTDMCLIYVGPEKINKYIEEMKRITRGRVVLCEFHSRNWLKRLVLRLRTGYNAYNYSKLLKRHGFYDVEILKMPEDAYPGAKDLEFRYMITAVAPKRIN